MGLTRKLSCLDVYMARPQDISENNEDRICARESYSVGAFTHNDFNVITFCPYLWENLLSGVAPRLATISEINKPTPDTAVPISLEIFQSISSTFLHEYTHLVGRGSGDLTPNFLASLD